MAFELTAATFILLFGTGFAAGFVDSIAGGGGLVSLPVLLSIGLPPQLALGTNKLQGSCGALSSVINYTRKGVVNPRQCLTGIFFTFMGAALGAILIQHIRAGFIRPLIPLLLLGVFIYTLLSPDLGKTRRQARMQPLPFYLLFGIGLGFYDGFFGPGTGSFWTGALLVFLGMDMTAAAGHTRVMNFTSNIVALGLFALGGNVLYSAGLTMAAGQIIGARIGSGLAIQRGAAFIRPLFLTVVFATIIRLIYVNYF